MKVPQRFDNNSSDSDVVDLDELYRAALARSHLRRANASAPQHTYTSRTFELAGVAFAVITAHVAIVSLLIQIDVPPTHETALADSRVSVVTLPAQHVSSKAIPIPEVLLLAPTVEISTLRFTSFEVPDDGLVSGIVGPTSAPELDRSVTIDPRPYALRAGLAPGNMVTVLLAIEVLADGSAGAITIVSGTGNSIVDSVAVDVARILRWIPGTVDRRARVMRIQFPLTLGVPA